MMLVSLTVGKVDAGVTVLLTQDKRLIEFPSILLPPNISSGSIVDITVARNTASEQAADAAFAALQRRIYTTFGVHEPAAPVLRCRNATQTSVVLEWDPVRLATADLLSLVLYRNGQKAGPIPRPLQMHSTKISGLAVDTEYNFHLVLRTSAGTLTSERVAVRTHKMTDLSGITISTGILPAAVRERLAGAVARIGAKMVAPDPGAVRIDTTHFVTTEGRGVAWEKAVEQNIPVVRPEWVEACERMGRILGVTKFYLDAVRPGPNDHDTLPAPQTAPAPPPAPASSNKDLPQSPPASSAPAPGAAASRRESRPPAQANGDNNSESGSGSDSDGDHDHNSNGAPSNQKMAGHPGDDQKVALGDREREQKLALRRKQNAAAESEGSEDDEDEEDEATKTKLTRASSGLDDGRKVSPGDGNSFQDVDL